MVEIIYNDANTNMMKAENLIRLPKNIRQIGIVGEKIKIYTEDYVKSYLSQHFERNAQTGFILFGKTIAATDRQYIFIDGAISVDTDTIFHKNIEVYAEAWEKLNIAAKEYFDGLEIVGWACEGDNEYAEGIHRRFFQEGSKIYIRLNDTETEYNIINANGMQLQEGYYIYYARNEAMQTYMIEQQNEGQTGSEELCEERAIEQFRQIMKERKEIIRHGKMVTALSCVSSFLALLVLAIGITMVNNYEKMQAMEVAIVELTTTIGEEEAFAQTEPPQEQKEDIAVEEADPAKELLNPTEDSSVEQEDMSDEIKEVVLLEEPLQENFYIVQKGDTLARISMQFYQTRDMVDAICEQNNIYDKDMILCGQKILLP